MSEYHLITTKATIAVTLDEDNAAKSLAIFLPDRDEPAIVIDARLIRTALIASFEPLELDDDGGAFVPDPELHEAHDEEVKRAREEGLL